MYSQSITYFLQAFHWYIIQHDSIDGAIQFILHKEAKQRVTKAKFLGVMLTNT